jgi:hypothetical protein
VHKRFKPDAHPGPRKAKAILAHEVRIWGRPSAYNRIDCESSWRWWEQNGQYLGFGQIGPWWGYAWPLTPRKVRFVRHKKTKEGDVKLVYHGTLPRDATQFHGWANIRVTQRAASGDGPSTAWSCSL